ncbi:hypothetical protein [Microbacterium sp. NPDC076911]|uniref:hypothetical protein n=1 Tax=Microbacterium sp. NPDC076911 TaxID=3154958 RepID=UPI003433A708
MTGQERRRKHSPAVYRRRRIVVLLAIIAIAGSVWLLIAQPWQSWGVEPEPTAGATEPVAQSTASELPAAGSTAAATPAATAQPTSDVPTASPDATPVVTPCVESAITVIPATDQSSYAADENPQFSITLTNDGETDCSLNVGTSTQKFEVSSGSDVWWRSTDCQSEPSDMVVMLAAGQTVSSAAPLEWDRTRSSVGTCDDDTRSRAAGGGATYHLSVEIGGIPSFETASFQLY